MSLWQYLLDRLAGMQLDCPVLPAPALAGTIDDDGAVMSEQWQALVAERTAHNRSAAHET